MGGWRRVQLAAHAGAEASMAIRSGVAVRRSGQPPTPPAVAPDWAHSGSVLYGALAAYAVAGGTFALIRPGADVPPRARV